MKHLIIIGLVIVSMWASTGITWAVSPKPVWVLAFAFTFGDFEPPNRVNVPMVFTSRRACLDETAYLHTDRARADFVAREVLIIIDCMPSEVLKAGDLPAPIPQAGEVRDDTKIIMDGDLRPFTLYDDKGQGPHGFITGKADCERVARVQSSKYFNLHCELGMDPRAPKGK